MRLDRRLRLMGLCVLVSACATDGGNLSETVSQETSPAELYVRMGVSYMKRGNLETALERLQHALKVDSDYSEAHNAIAVLYEGLKLPEKSRYHYRKAVGLNPANIGALNNYGRFLCERGEYGDADRYFEKAIGLPLNDRPWVALTNAGRCLRMAGDQAGAEKRLREALKRNPRFSPALLEMAEISFSQNNPLSTRAFLQRYLEVAKHTPETLWLGIQCERALGNGALAEEYGDLLLQNYPQSEQALRYRDRAL